MTLFVLLVSVLLLAHTTVGQYIRAGSAVVGAAGGTGSWQNLQAAATNDNDFAQISGLCSGDSQRIRLSNLRVEGFSESVFTHFQLVLRASASPGLQYQIVAAQVFQNGSPRSTVPNGNVANIPAQDQPALVSYPETQPTNFGLLGIGPSQIGTLTVDFAVRFAGGSGCSGSSQVKLYEAVIALSPSAASSLPNPGVNAPASGGTSSYSITSVQPNTYYQQGGGHQLTLSGSFPSSGSPMCRIGTQTFNGALHTTATGSSGGGASGPVLQTFTLNVVAKTGSFTGHNEAFTVTSTGLNNVRQPVLQLQAGGLYEFRNNAPCSHPFYITTDFNGGNNGAGQISDGIQPGPNYAQICGGQSVRWLVPTSFNSGTNVFYNCRVHQQMGNRINVVPPGTGTATNTANVGSLPSVDTVIRVAVERKRGGDRYVGRGHPNGFSLSDGKKLTNSMLPALSIAIGTGVQFQNLQSCSHPLYISTSATGGGANEVTDGIQDNNGLQTYRNGSCNGGTWNWYPTKVGRYYYQCRFHTYMGYIIDVVKTASNDGSLDRCPATTFTESGVTFNLDVVKKTDDSPFRFTPGAHTNMFRVSSSDGLNVAQPQPALVLYVGKTYTFINSGSCTYPLQITTSTTGGDNGANQISRCYPNQTTTLPFCSGRPMRFSPTRKYAGTSIYYQSKAGKYLGNRITIIDDPSHVENGGSSGTPGAVTPSGPGVITVKCTTPQLTAPFGQQPVAVSFDGGRTFTPPGPTINLVNSPAPAGFWENNDRITTTPVGGTAAGPGQMQCADPTCSGKGTCNLGNGQCQCNPGYTGTRCETLRPCWDMPQNREHCFTSRAGSGRCVDQPPGSNPPYKCECNNGFLVAPDQRSCTEIQCPLGIVGDKRCGGNGFCLDQNTCQCNPGFAPPDCTVTEQSLVDAAANDKKEEEEEEAAAKRNLYLYIGLGGGGFCCCILIVCCVMYFLFAAGSSDSKSDSSVTKTTIVVDKSSSGRRRDSYRDRRKDSRRGSFARRPSRSRSMRRMSTTTIRRQQEEQAMAEQQMMMQQQQLYPYPMQTMAPSYY